LALLAVAVLVTDTVVAVRHRATAATEVVPSSLPTPPGIVPLQVQPPVVRVAVTLAVPSTWTPTRPRSPGVRFAMRDTSPVHAFLLLGVFDAPPLPPLTFGQDRALSLRRLGAHVASLRRALVDGFGAAVLHYQLRVVGTPQSVDDTEYDVVIGGRAVIVLVLGELHPARDPAVLRWVASTFQIA
jgi:hypothetical protein